MDIIRDFFWQVAENSRFKYIWWINRGTKFSSKVPQFASFSLIHSILHRLTLEENT